MSRSKVALHSVPSSSSQDERIEDYLKMLGLEGMLAYFKKLSEDNIQQHRTPKDYFESLLEKQRINRQNGRIKARLIQAGFGKIDTLDEFIFDRDIQINRLQIQDLATCNFIKEKKNVIFSGDTGLGKTHLAKSLGVKAIEQECYIVRFIEIDRIIGLLLFKHRDIDSQKRFFDNLSAADLLILDEIKSTEIKLPPLVNEFLYKLIRQRHGQKSTIFTTSKDPSEWGKLFGKYAKEAVDRILDTEYAISVSVQGKSFRSEPKPIKT